jgi:hypothetical protein
MIHSFGIAQPGVDHATFDSVIESFRSDVEQRHTPIAIHNPESADLRTARQLADEIINVSGAELIIYLRTENSDYDAVWDEDPDPTYWTPIPIKGYFKPAPLEVELKKWGADTSSNQTEITFSFRMIFNIVGERMLRTGDVIQVPFNSAPINPKNYRILNATPSGNFRYNWLYFKCQAELLTADVTVRPELDMQDDEEEESGGRYRESL